MFKREIFYLLIVLSLILVIVGCGGILEESNAKFGAENIIEDMLIQENVNPEAYEIERVESKENEDNYYLVEVAVIVEDLYREEEYHFLVILRVEDEISYNKHFAITRGSYEEVSESKIEFDELDEFTFLDSFKRMNNWPGY